MLTQNERIELMKKSVSQLTDAELDSLMMPVGTPDLPYPMATVTSKNGRTQIEVGTIVSNFAIPTFKTFEEVNGSLFRKLPLPSMLFIARDLMAKLDPKSKDRLITADGEASGGKTTLAMDYAKLVHPEGAIMVDCGGSNMRELIFRTVIDYGQGVKELLDKKVAEGETLQSSVDALQSAFPGSVVEANGTKIIDWDIIGKPRTRQEDDGAGGAKTVQDETWEEATSRATAVLSMIYSKEGISQQNNAFGIKTVEGEFIRSFRTGQPLIADEYSKALAGSFDSWQQALQFAHGEKGFETITLKNPMAVAGDSMQSITLNINDRKPGWFVFMAGNESSDGATTHETSFSTRTRLDIHRVTKPELVEWEQRLSQIYTSLPLTTLCDLFEEDVKNSPEGFAEWLVDLRCYGLSVDEVKAIPAHEIYFLKNFPATVTAMKNLAATYYNNDLFADENSEKYTGKDKKNMELSQEVSDGGQNIRVSFRQAIEHFNRAVQTMPTVSPKNIKRPLHLQLNDVAKRAMESNRGAVEPAWHNLGKNVARAYVEWIVNMTSDMPKMRETLITLCETNSIVPPNLVDGKPVAGKQFLSDLLKYDPLKDMGGTDELKAMQAVLMAYVRANSKKKLSGSNEDIIPLSNLGKVMADFRIEREKPVSANQNDPNPKYLIGVPNPDQNFVQSQPVLPAYALPVYYELSENAPQYELQSLQATLASLALPDFKDVTDDKGNVTREKYYPTLERIWPTDMMENLERDPIDRTKKPDEIAYAEEPFKILMANSELKFSLSILEVNDKDDKPTFLIVVRDTYVGTSGDAYVGGTMAMGFEKIDTALLSVLKDSNIKYIDLSVDEMTKYMDNNNVEVVEPLVVKQVNDFLADGARQRAQDGKMADGKITTQKVVADMIRAFSALCEVSNSNGDGARGVVGIGTTFGKLVYENKAKPFIYTSILQFK